MLRRMILNWAIEFGPNLVFFVSFQWFGFFIATAAMIGANMMGLFISQMMRRRPPIFPVATGLLILFFGGATILLQEPRILMFEVTLYNAFFALVIYLGFHRQKNVFKLMFSELFAITDRGWNRLAHRWGFFLLFHAVANELVRENFSVATWVYFKFYMAIIVFVFGLAQLRLFHRERLPEANFLGLKVG